MNLKLKDNPKIKLVNIPSKIQNFVEYIVYDFENATNVSYLDTGVLFNSEYLYYLKFKTNPGIVDTCFIQSAKNWSAPNEFCIWCTNENTIRIRGLSVNSKDINISSGIHELVLTKSLIKIDNTNVSTSTYTSNINRNIYIGADPNLAMAKIGYIYKFEIKNGNEYIRNFYPAISNESGHIGEPCLYDSITDSCFYYGTGLLIAGNPIIVSDSISNNFKLKCTNLFHKNCPNIGGWSLLNEIYNYQAEHQDDVKYIVYIHSDTWQNIITTYPSIVTYANNNHRLVFVICESNNPTETASNFMNALSEYPSIANVIAEYPSIANVIVEYPSIANLIIEETELASIINEWNPIVHSLINTGKRIYLVGDTNSGIDTGYIPKTNFEINLTGKFLTEDGNTFAQLGKTNDSKFTFDMPIKKNNKWALRTYWTNDYPYDINTTELMNIVMTQTTGTVNGVNKFTASGDGSTRDINLWLFTSRNYSGSTVINSFKGNVAISDYIYKLNNQIVLHLVPYKNSMIDLLTYTIYPNVGTGEFNILIEDK